MALILPPALDYDSFVSLADATVVIEALTLDGPDWASTPVDDQERYLRIATRNIKNGIDLTVNPIDPAAIPACLPEATALMAIHDIKNNISNSVVSTSVTGAIKKEQVGSIVQEYYDVAAGKDTSTSIDLIPDLAKPCLASFGYVFKASTGSLTQITLGRS